MTDSERKTDITQAGADTFITGGVALLAGASPAAGAVVAVLQPVLSYLAARGIAKAFEHATHVSGMSAEQIVAALRGDVDGMRLLAVSVETASAAIHEDKLRAVGACLAAGVRPDAVMDEEAIVIGILRFLEPMHLRLLQLMSRPHSRVKDDGTSEPMDAWLLSDVPPLDAALSEDVVPTLMQHLGAQGAVEFISGFGALVYKVTPLGRRLLDRVGDQQ